jgi:predicted O-methyltransferase YrrM
MRRARSVLTNLHPGPRRRSTQTQTRSSGFLDVDACRDDFYDGGVVGAAMIGSRAVSPAIHEAAKRIVDQLQPDRYATYVDAFMAEGAHRAAADWRYADIVTCLAAATTLLSPISYLEIGVRRGRSMAVVGALAPDCSIVGIDLWQEDYASMSNPGEAHVRAELAKVGHQGPLELITGSSHDVLPRLIRDRSELNFDLITVDGDHSKRGATRDLRRVLPLLRIGGALIFDDIAHRLHPYLRDVWQRVVQRDRRYSTWMFDDVGFGVAVAVRRW